MKKNSRLNKHMAAAKKVVAVREFDGEDGDYITKLSRVSHGTKDGVMYIVFEFIITEGEHTGKKTIIFIQFKDNENRTIEQVQDEFFVMLQLLGVDTSAPEAEMDKVLNKLRVDMTPITVRIKSGKRGGKFTNVVGIGQLAEELTDAEYVPDNVASDVPPDDVATDAPPEDDWSEAEAPPEETPPEEEATDNSPEAWKGYEMSYRGKSYLVTEANNTTGKCQIKDLKTKKVYVVNFSDLEPPAE